MHLNNSLSGGISQEDYKRQKLELTYWIDLDFTGVPYKVATDIPSRGSLNK